MRWVGILLFIFSVGFSQKATVQLSDYHASQITSIIATADGKSLLTADQSGKILLQDLNTFTFLKTIKPSDGYPIDNLQLLGSKGAVLFKSKDSIFYLDYQTGTSLGKSPLKGKVLHQNNPRFKLISNQIDNFTYILLVIDLEKNITTPIKTEEEVISALVTEEGDHVIYVEEKMYLNQQKLSCTRLLDQQNIWEQILNSTNKILHVFNSKSKYSVDAVTFSESVNELAVYTINEKEVSTQPLIAIPFTSTRSATVVTDYFNTDQLLVVTTSLLSLYPVLISFENGKYAFNRCQVEQTNSPVYYNASKKELLFTNDHYNYTEGIACITVFDVPTLKVKKAHPPSTANFYVGAFLPQDNWIVHGNAMEEASTQIKYYTNGTFYNRFAQFNFNDYLEQHFKIKTPIRSHFFDYSTGKLAFFNSDYSIDKNYIYQYDLIQDQLEVLLELNNNYLPEILDYNEKTNILLLSKEHYNPNYSNPQVVTWVKNKTLQELPGRYKAVKISNNGKYILTINYQNFIEIYDTEQKSVFKQAVTPGFYTVFVFEETGFVIANSHTAYSKNKCAKESIILDLDTSQNYVSQIQDCVFVTHVSYKNSKLALFIENVGLMLNQKQMPIYFPKNPKALSFNEDATKIMISHYDGKIGIYDTTTFEELGAMFHPSKKEHIFYSSKGYYFSNTDAQYFIHALKEKERINLEQVDAEVFNPKEVLSLFGKPNEEYIAVLTKAIALRKEKKDLDSNYTQNWEKPIKTTTDGKQPSNLYVLTIGVSDYQQNEYSLTFADKDALDIADLYGSLNPTIEAFYKQKFYGKKFTLHFLKNETTYQLKKHLGEYNSVVDLFSIHSDNTKWLEIKENEAFIWDFKKENIESIALPKDFKIDLYSSKTTVICHPDSDTFYLRDTDYNYYQLDTLNRSFQKIELPFDIKDSYHASIIQPITNNRWVYFKDLQNGTCQLLIGSTNQPNNEHFTFDIKKYFDLNQQLQTDEYLYGPMFKCVSKEGTQLLYTVNDQTFWINLKERAIPQRLPIQLEYSDEVSFSSDQTLSVLHSTEGKYRNKITTYTLDGKIIATTTFEEDKFNIRGVSLVDSNPSWIKETKGLLESNLLKDDHNLANYHPYSFKQVNVMSLINDKATNQSIKENLIQFFKEVKPQDQVVVFLAGHGVLDSKNQYYYAPYDMNFNQVTEKGVGFDFILDQLKRIPANNKLLLMDSCHSGNTLDMTQNSISQKEKSDSKGQRGSISRGIKQNKAFKLSDVVNSVFDNFLSTSGVTILSASSGSDVAYENEELGNGAFTTAYLKVLEKKIGGVLITEENSKKEVLLTENIISELMKEVANLTHGKQLPDIREINTLAQIKLW